MASGAPDFQPTNPADDQFYRIIDVRNLSKPIEVGRWWMPGTRVGDSTPPPARHPKFDSGFRAHNTNVFPERPDRAYVGYISGGAVILDIADKARPKLISHWRYSPPYTGFTHTVLPLFGRELLIVRSEEHTSELQSLTNLVCRLLLEKKKKDRRGGTNQPRSLAKDEPKSGRADSPDTARS